MFTVMQSRFRSLLIGIIVVFVVFTGSSAVWAADVLELSSSSPVNVVINGEEMVTEGESEELMQPLLINGRTYLPIRAVAEQLDVPILWVPDSHTVYLGDLRLSSNPLLKEWDMPPFDQIQPDHFMPALEYAVASQKNEVNEITHNPARPTFENTIEALERTGQLLNKIEHILYLLQAANTNPELQEVVMKASVLLTNHGSDLLFNEALFDRVEEVYKEANRDELSGEQLTLLENTYRNFVQNGINLNKQEKSRLRGIDNQLASLSNTFSRNLLADTNAAYLHMTDEKQVKGIPDYVRENAAAEASRRELDGWCFTTEPYVVSSVLTYADDRATRKQMKEMYGSLGTRDVEHDNREVIPAIANLRLEKANILGYSTYADYVLGDRMAQNKETVMSFLDQMVAVSLPAAKKDLEELQVYAEEQGVKDTLECYDYGYYEHKLTEERYDFDREAVKDYFELGRVKEGVFELVKRLYGLRFVRNEEVSVYHPDVEVYEVYDDNDRFMGRFYLDFYTREGKSGGNWATVFRSQAKIDDQDVLPVINLVYNFPTATDDRPSLLSFGEVSNFLHEFGHGLHFLLSDVEYASLSSSGSIIWDYVEMPSQLMENWKYEKDFLYLFARHYETGEMIPDEMVEKLQTMRTVRNASGFLGQLQYTLLDMDWHTIEQPYTGTVEAFEMNALEDIRIFSVMEWTLISPSFSHIFDGGYAAGYYGYLWAQALDADVFQVFKKNGLFDRKTGEAFRQKVLSKGYSETPMKLFKDFMGREPSVDALMVREGFK